MDLIGAALLLVEIGADMQAFGSAERLASWVGSPLIADDLVSTVAFPKSASRDRLTKKSSLLL